MKYTTIKFTPHELFAIRNMIYCTFAEVLKDSLETDKRLNILNDWPSNSAKQNLKELKTAKEHEDFAINFVNKVFK